MVVLTAEEKVYWKVCHLAALKAAQTVSQLGDLMALIAGKHLAVMWA